MSKALNLKDGQIDRANGASQVSPIFRTSGEFDLCASGWGKKRKPGLVEAPRLRGWEGGWEGRRGAEARISVGAKRSAQGGRRDNHVIDVKSREIA
jgi:hypothetical protein